MYVPILFHETDQEKLFDLIQQHSFGLLVSDHEGEPFASHLPFLLDRSFAPKGCLIGHMARANPQWRQAEGKNVLAIFAGPHAYVSPTWYEAEEVVPTWNYVAVHAYGRFQAIHEPDALTEILQKYVAFFEAAMPRPWTFDGESEFAQKMVQAVVGFRIEISRLEGKWKLSQNQPRERRGKVARALSTSTREEDRAVAALMESLRAGEKG